MTRCKKLQLDQQVFRPCKYIRPDINLIDRIVEIDYTNFDFGNLLVAGFNASLVIFVFDGFVFEDQM